MRKISELRERVSERIRQDEEEREKETVKILRSYRSGLKKHLKAALTTTAKDMGGLIRAQQRHLRMELVESAEAIRQASEELKKQRKLISRVGWLWVLIPTATGLLICGLTWGWVMYQAHRLEGIRDEIARQEVVLSRLEMEGGKIRFSKCGEKARLCAQIDEGAPAYKGGYRILQGY